MLGRIPSSHYPRYSTYYSSMMYIDDTRVKTSRGCVESVRVVSVRVVSVRVVSESGQ